MYARNISINYQDVSSPPPPNKMKTVIIGEQSEPPSDKLPYFLDCNARVLLVSSELLAGVVFEGAVYSFQPLGY